MNEPRPAEFSRNSSAAALGRPRRQATALLVTHAAWGTILVLWPATIIGASPDRGHRSVAFGARALGARHLIQAAALARHAGEPTPGWSMWVDATHGASMLALALTSSGLRPAALRSAAVASTFAAWSFAARQ